jgi:diaminopimelate epimerase
MRFSSWHALGNVYLVGPPLADPTPEHVRELVGDADGLVEVAASGEVVIWNADGSQAELSGNATRIAAAWLREQTGADEVTIVAGGREVVVRFRPDGLAEQELGEVQVGEPEEVEGIRFTPVEVGNPHAVVLGEPDEITRVGPLLETHPHFPQRTNVQVARVEDDHVTARVWERGVGETSSSGTGAVAVAAACRGEGETVVRFPGGELTVRIVGGRATLIGPAEPLAG